MTLPQEVCDILKRFYENGYEAFVVGGAVRDSLMGKIPYDFDITTNAKPEITKQLFSDKKIIETGIKHGTVTVIFNFLPVEITTYRVDIGYSDSRHPDKVEFSDNVKNDLARRDFTVNAICFSPYNGYYDPFNGIPDIKNKILRTVGNPEKRFEEDALRILRLLRFSSTLDFKIDPETSKAALKLQSLICRISKERIFSEFKKTLIGIKAHSVIQNYFSVFATALGLNAYKNIQPNFSYLKNCENSADIRFSAFILCFEKNNAEQLATDVLRFLKADNHLKSECVALIKGFFLKPPETKKEIKCILKTFSSEQLKKILNIWHCFNICSDTQINKINYLINEILNNNECYKISHLKINGNTLLNIGISPQKIGFSLNMLLDAVINEKCKNTPEALLKYIKNQIKQTLQ